MTRTVFIVFTIIAIVATAQPDPSYVYHWWFATIGEGCGGPSLVQRMDQGVCQNRGLKGNATFNCVQPKGLCAFYTHFTDDNCTIPASNHTLLCQACQSESGVTHSYITCDATSKLVHWHGDCDHSCTPATCQFKDVDRMGQCILADPGSEWPAVMLVSIGACPQMVRNETWMTGSGCQGESVGVSYTPVRECDPIAHTMWTCNSDDTMH